MKGADHILNISISEEKNAFNKDNRMAIGGHWHYRSTVCCKFGGKKNPFVCHNIANIENSHQGRQREREMRLVRNPRWR